MSKPIEENEKSFAGENDWEPDTEYNYFQIFRTTVELSDTALNSLMYGNPNDVSAQMKQWFYKINNQLSEQLVRWRRVARTGSANGSFAGFDFYIDTVWGNVVDASSAAISSTLINNLIQMIKEDAGSVDTILCNTNQARKISAFNVGGNNPVVTRDETTTGSYVMRFVSDIPVAWGLISNIIVDERCPKDAVYLLNLDKIALVPYKNRALKLVDGTANGQDGKTAILRGEYSLVIKDGKFSHWKLEGLTV